MVDAVALQGSPGTIRRFDHDALLGLSGQTGSAHHLDFSVCLRWLLHANPEIACARFRLWGVEPARVAPQSGLSRMVAAAVAPVAQEIHWSAFSRTVDVTGLVLSEMPCRETD